MRPLLPILIPALAGMALAAFLGGAARAGVLVGGGLGLALGVLVALAEARLFGGRRAFQGLLFGFLAKLAALLAATGALLVLEPSGLDPAAFVLSFLGALLLASAGGWLGALRGARAEAYPR